MSIGISLAVCPCTMHVPGANRGQKRVSDALELELQVVVSLYVGAGT